MSSLEAFSRVYLDSMRFGKTLLDPKRIISQSGIKPGMHVADFGCGRTGHILFPAAHAVGDSGTVFAVDIVQDHLKMLEGLCSMQGLCGIVPVWGDFERSGGVRIPDKTLDRIFLVNNLSFLESAEGFAEEAKRLLKPTGNVIIVDWKKRVPHPVAPAADSLFDLHDAELLFARLGLKKIDEIPVSQTHWGMVLA